MVADVNPALIRASGRDGVGIGKWMSGKGRRRISTRGWAGSSSVQFDAKCEFFKAKICRNAVLGGLRALLDTVR